MSKVEAVKFADADEKVVTGLAAPYGGPYGGKDLDGEYFSEKTDFALKWYSEIPLLYHHGMDDNVQIDVVGTVKSRDLTDVGVWAEAQLDASSKYFEAIKDLVKRGKLFFSSGAVQHLIQATKSGEITRWPMVELSLTPTPSNLLAATSYKGCVLCGHDDHAEVKSDKSPEDDASEPMDLPSPSQDTVVNMTDLANAVDELIDNAIGELDAGNYDQVDAMLSALAVVSDQQLALLGTPESGEVIDE